MCVNYLVLHASEAVLAILDSLNLGNDIVTV